MKRKLAFAFALLALASILPARADFYWLAVGIPYNANQTVDSGAGNYLVLTNDNPEVTGYAPVKLYDVRRTENGGTKLYKNNGLNGTAPYEGCEYGGAHYDLTLSIKDAEGTEYTFVGFAKQAFQGNNYLGSIKLPDSTEFIRYGTFWQSRYLTDFQWPADMTKLTIEDRLFDTCQRLVGPIEIPSKFVNCGDRMFCDCISLVGIGGVSVTNVGANAIQNCPKLEALELGDGESVTFANESMRGSYNENASVPKKLLFRSAPPVLNDQWLGNTGNSVVDFVANRGVVVYIPFNATKDGPTDSWVQFQTAVDATQSTTSTPNSLTFPTQNGDGTWTDGALKISGSSAKNKTVTVRFWDPDSTATAALMAY